MQVQTPVALVDKNLDRRSSKMREPTRAAAEAFVQYLFSPEAQAAFAESGFRFCPLSSSSDDVHSRICCDQGCHYAISCSTHISEFHIRDVGLQTGARCCQG